MINALRTMDIPAIVIQILAVFLAMSVHEMAHALVSYWMGDSLAKSRGRVSLNPFQHIDWLGLACLLLFGFGWAKPVPVDPYKYKDPKAGMVWTAFAGPLANFLLAFLCAMFYCMIARFWPSFVLGSLGKYVIVFLTVCAAINLGFGIFNLIPIPPLDGARVFWSFLPDREYFKMQQPNQIIVFLFLIVIASGVLNAPLSMLRSGVFEWMLTFWSSIF